MNVYFVFKLCKLCLLQITDTLRMKKKSADFNICLNVHHVCVFLWFVFRTALQGKVSNLRTIIIHTHDHRSQTTTLVKKQLISLSKNLASCADGYHWFNNTRKSFKRKPVNAKSQCAPVRCAPADALAWGWSGRLIFSPTFHSVSSR